MATTCTMAVGWKILLTQGVDFFNINHLTKFLISRSHLWISQKEFHCETLVYFPQFHFWITAKRASIILQNDSNSSLGSLSNHDDDGNKNVTNLHIWQWKIIVLHALHVHISFLDISQTFSFFPRREMTCFAVVWTTWAYDDKCSILSFYLWSAGSNLIPG